MSNSRCFYESELPGELTALATLYPVLQGWCSEGDLGRAEGHRVIVAVTEAVTNAVIHAETDSGFNSIYVALWLEEEGLRAEVGDRGQWGWTPPVPPTVEQWEQTGGRGLELIRQLATSSNIRPRPDGGTLVTMIFKKQSELHIANDDGPQKRSVQGGTIMDSRIETFDDVDVMRITGRIDLVTSNTLKDNIRERLQRQRTNLILNMERVDFINSSGLGALVSILKDVRIASGRLVLSNLAPYVQEIFEITQLSNVFEIFASEQDAIDALSAANVTANTKS